MAADVHIGTAGWGIPATQVGAFATEGSQLQRYAVQMNCVEINSSFYRSHRPQTYERWAASTPPGFRFAVKLPRQISHEHRLQGGDELLARFAGEAGSLGAKWAVLLVQLPPSLRFDAGVAGHFFERVHAVFDGAVVCEPRHLSWFTPEAERFMRDNEISRAAVDPAPWAGSSEPAGWLQRACYFRWHGSPRMYWSPYEEAWLQAQARRLAELPCEGQRWCILDNTAAGAALPNAMQLQAMLRDAHHLQPLPRAASMVRGTAASRPAPA